MEGLARDDVTAALEQRRAVQATLMRVTIHLVAARDYWLFALATRQARRTLWLRAVRGRGERGARCGGRRARRRAARRRRRTLHRKEIEELVGKQRADGVGLWIDLVRVPPSGTWERRRADLYAAAEDWLGPPSLSERRGGDHLVRRYLAGFGPASRADIASYTGSRRATSPRSSRACGCGASAADRRRAARRPARSAARSRHAGAGALPADLGRDAARPRPPHRPAARGAPAEDLPRQEPALVAGVPRRRRGRRHVAPPRRAHRARRRSPRSTPRHGARSPRRPSAWPPSTPERLRRARRGCGRASAAGCA